MRIARKRLLLPFTGALVAAACLLLPSGDAQATLDCSQCEHVYDNCVRGGPLTACVAQYMDCLRTYCHDSPEASQSGTATTIFDSAPAKAPGTTAAKPTRPGSGSLQPYRYGTRR